MKKAKINFKESILVPKLLFDKMESDLRGLHNSFTLDKFKSNILIPPDEKLKKFDFNKKFKRESKHDLRRGDEQNLAAPKDFSDSSLQQRMKTDITVDSLNSSNITAGRNLPKKYEQMREFLQAVSPANQKRAEEILRSIIELGAGHVEWGDNNEIKIGKERVLGGNIISAIRAFVGENEDPLLLYYPLYKELLEIGTPEILFEHYIHTGRPAFSRPTSYHHTPLISRYKPAGYSLREVDDSTPFLRQASGYEASPMPFSNLDRIASSTPISHPRDFYAASPNYSHESSKTSPALTSSSEKRAYSNISQDSYELPMSRKNKRKQQRRAKSLAGESLGETGISRLVENESQKLLAREIPQWESISAKSPPIKQRLRGYNKPGQSQRWENI